MKKISCIKKKSKCSHLILLTSLIFIFCCACNKQNFNDTENISSDNASTSESILESSESESTTSYEESTTFCEEVVFIHPEGMNLGSRFSAPIGYTKVTAEANSLLEFMRNMELKPDGSPVLFYDGTVQTQSHHAAVFTMDVGNVDLQQCADSIMRVYAEYLWSLQAYDRIGFHLTSGFWMDYLSWRDGNRIVVNGSNVQWTKMASYDDSYENFRKYLTQVFVYAGTLSLDVDSTPIAVSEAVPGDMILKGGSPGHAILIVDMAINAEGKKCFLLAEGHMPAEEFHVMQNPAHLDDPWYYEDEIVFPFWSPEFTFKDGSVQRYPL